MTVNTNPHVSPRACSTSSTSTRTCSRPAAAARPSTRSTRYTNSPADTENPGLEVLELLDRPRDRRVRRRGRLHRQPRRARHQPDPRQPRRSSRAEQAALVAATKNSNAIPSVQARRVYPQYGVRTLIPAYVGPAGNDVEARVGVQRRLRVGEQAASATACSSAASYTRSKFESNNDASLGETGTDGSNQRPQSMFDYEAEWSLSQFDVPEPLRRELPLGGPGPEVGLPEARPRRLAVLRHHRVPVGPAVHDRHRRRLERRRDHRLRPAEPRRRLRCDWDDDHKTFTNNGYVRGAARHQQPAARQRPRRRHARPQHRARRRLLEHRPQPAEAVLPSATAS